VYEVYKWSINGLQARRRLLLCLLMVVYTCNILFGYQIFLYNTKLEFYTYKYFIA